MEELNNYRISELKALLQEQGLNTRGRKAELINRLLTTAKKNEPSTSGSGFVTSLFKQKPVACSDAAVENPSKQLETAQTTQSGRNLSKNNSSMGMRQQQANSATDEASQQRHTQSTKANLPQSEEEKRAARSLRFDHNLDTKEFAKRQKRAQRFNLSCADTESQKRLERAARFGHYLQPCANGDQASQKMSWNARLADRLLRFSP